MAKRKSKKRSVSGAFKAGSRRLKKGFKFLRGGRVVKVRS